MKQFMQVTDKTRGEVIVGLNSIVSVNIDEFGCTEMLLARGEVLDIKETVDQIRQELNENGLILVPGDQPC